MKTLFQMGGPLPGYRLGQWDIIGSLLSTAISSGVQFEIAREARASAEKARKRAEEQAAQIQASQEAAEKKRQEDVLKAQEAQQAAATPGSPTYTPQILGVDSTTFYVGAGILGVGAIIITLLATR
jgi:hypothetical protein